MNLTVYKQFVKERCIRIISYYKERSIIVSEIYVTMQISGSPETDIKIWERDKGFIDSAFVPIDSREDKPMLKVITRSGIFNVPKMKQLYDDDVVFTQCKECGQFYMIKKSQLQWFEDRNLYKPKTCLDCRNNKEGKLG